MDVQEGFPKNKLLQEEHETEQEVTTQYTHQVNIYMSSQIKLTKDKTTVDRVNLQQSSVNNDGKQDGQIQLTIKQQYGEQRQISFNNEVKQLSIVELKKRVFPEQYGQGYKIIFIQNGKLIDDQQLLKNLEFSANPILHVQIYPSIHHHSLQHQPQSQISHTENWQNQLFFRDEICCDMILITIQFFAAFLLGFFFNFVGLFVVCCFPSSDCNKMGALAGFLFSFQILVKIFIDCGNFCG